MFSEDLRSACNASHGELEMAQAWNLQAEQQLLLKFCTFISSLYI